MKYGLLCELNHKQVFGEVISDEDKRAAVALLLQDTDPFALLRQADEKRLTGRAPLFYIPPYPNGRKQRLIQGYLPKTAILYENHYELEMLRILAMYAPTEPAVDVMVKATLTRLQSNCFGNACRKGECFPTGIAVLRFLSAVRAEAGWINKLLYPLCEAFASCGDGQAAVQKGLPVSYLLMALTDVGTQPAIQVIERKKEWLLGLLRRGWITGRLTDGSISEGDTYNLMFKYIIRNALGLLPAYRDIAKHEIYVDPADGRCYCDV